MKEQQKNIIQLTENAESHIQKMIQQRQAKAFRLSVKKTGCSGYMYKPEVVDKINPDDVRVETERGLTLFLDAHCLSLIKGTTVDYVRKGLGQSQLQFINPNAASECGCGESFNLKEEVLEK